MVHKVYTGAATGEVMQRMDWYLAGAKLFTWLWLNPILRYPIYFLCGFLHLANTHIQRVSAKLAVDNDEI